MRADYVSADLSKVTDIDRLWNEVIRLYPDGVDILINNGGMPMRYLPDWKNEPNHSAVCY